jgi:hypothetical protein
MSSITYKKQVTGTSKYIEFLHTGMEDKYARPVIISTTKLNISLTDDESKHIRYLLKKTTITKEEEKEYLNSLYRVIKTDRITYLILLDFIKSHKELYTNKLKKNNGEFEDYTIIAEGVTYPIYYKFKYKFFNALIMYLNVKNCDKNIINAINAL